MTISTTSGTKIFIGPVATEDTADDATAYAALTPWVEVGEVENLGEFGDTASSVTFAAIGDGRVRKSKGARDAGTLALVVGRDPLDEGQQALIAAQKTKFTYAFKIVAADAPTADYVDSVFYFRALVMGDPRNFGANDDVTRQTFNLDIDSEIIEVVANDPTP